MCDKSAFLFIICRFSLFSLRVCYTINDADLTECPDGLYGHECQENCSTNCIFSGSCDSMTGQCEGGCQAGWKKSKCDTSKDMQMLNICKTN